MSQSTNSLNRVSPEDALPEVVAPGASFLLPLFVVPLCIVTIIVMVWVAFHWVALRGSDAASDIENLRKNNDARWQAASNLADRLRNPRNTALRRDAQSADKVASILETELSGNLSGGAKQVEKDVNLRIYLCRAIGEFEVPQGLPVLLEAVQGKGATAAHEVQNLPVRRAAIEAIAVLISNVRAVDGADAAQPGDDFHAVLPALLEAASHRDSDSGAANETVSLRYTATFALGVLGGDEALARLEQLSLDAHPDVRYNAACGLARNGDSRAVIGLLAMLDPDDTSGVQAEHAPAARPHKRALIYSTALQAIDKLLDENESDDFEQLREAVGRLLNEEELDKPIRLQATEVLNRFQSRQQLTVDAGK